MIRLSNVKLPLGYTDDDIRASAEALGVAFRAEIGPELFDFLLDPPLLYGERDTSQDDAFGA